MTADGPPDGEERDRPASGAADGSTARGRGVGGLDRNVDARDLRARLVEQFADGERADVWRGLDRLLPTGEFLNVGYSPRFVPHVVGSSQRRLAAHLAAGLDERLPTTRTGLLDLGCGRGGPAVTFAARGFAVTGLDVVPYNLRLARENAGDVAAGFVGGDATRLPFAADAFGACAAVDSLVYVPEKDRAVAEVGRVVEAGGVLAAADLVAREGASGRDRERLDAFADVWDMASLLDLAEYREVLRGAGLAVESVEDVTTNSTGRFRKWSTLFLALADAPGGPLDRLLRRWGADRGAVVERVQRAHDALPHLRHVVVYARVPSTRGTPRGRRGSARSP